METKRINIDGKDYDVKAKVEKFDFSAHASQEEMLKAIKKWSPEKIVLVHGDKEVIEIFKGKIDEEIGIRPLDVEKGKRIKLND